MLKPAYRPILWLATVLCLALPQPAGCLDSPSASWPAYWRELRSPSYLWPDDGAIYYSLETKGGSKVHLVVVDMKTGKWRLVPAINEHTAPTSDTAIKNKASAAVNAGYFNLTDGASASYVLIGGKVVADPRTNKALIENPKLAPHLEAIFNRSEVRILSNEHGWQSVQIAAHNDPVPFGLKLEHSVQGGPRLLPALRDKEEAFVRTDLDGKATDSIGSRKPAARTAFGITPDGFAMLVCVSGNGQENRSTGVTLLELAELLKTLGCSEAINLDGGASSTMFVRLKSAGPAGVADMTQGQVVCGKTPETKVKSVLLLQKAVP